MTRRYFVFRADVKMSNVSMQQVCPFDIMAESRRRIAENYILQHYMLDNLPPGTAQTCGIYLAMAPSYVLEDMYMEPPEDMEIASAP